MKKVKTNALVAVMAIAAFTNSGCATIFGKSNYPITVNSNPNGAKLSIFDKKGVEIYKGNTPANITLKSSSGYFSKAEYQLKFDLDGHEQKTVQLTSKLNGWYFGNLLIGGLIGMLIVDPASGAMYKMNQTDVNEVLTKKNIAQGPSELKIIDINSLSEKTKVSLQQIN